MTQNLGNPIPKDRIVRAIQLIQCIGFLKLNKNKSDDWERIEDYCRRQLDFYASIETITPICCDGCGKLLRYSSTVNDKAYYGKDN